MDGVTIENLLKVEPHGKNPAPADALKRIGLAEKTGRGIDHIYEGSIIYGRPWLDYSETTSTNVRLFIQRAEADGVFTKFTAEEQKKNKKIVINICSNDSLFIKDGNRVMLDRIVEMTHLSNGRLLGTIEKLIEDGDC
ncbi:MAG: hypothetical protein II944_00910 [Ruminobacter sp.]|nr:hypothetical protein [Ruminobacter sp.]